METLKSKNVSIVLTNEVNGSDRQDNTRRGGPVFTGRDKKRNNGRYCQTFRHVEKNYIPVL